MKFGGNILFITLGRLALAALLVLAGGCSLKPAEFYQLEKTAAQQTPGEGVAILLGPIKLADYLQREQILQRQPDGRLLHSREGRWAGNLQEDIGHLLAWQLAQSTGNSHIALYPDRVGVHPQSQIVLSIARLDSGPQQPAVLEAQWRLLDAKGRTHDSNVVRLEQEHDGTLIQQIEAQSRLLQLLAEQLSGRLQSYLKPVLPERAKPRKPVEESKSPAISDVANEPEFYRF